MGDLVPSIAGVVLAVSFTAWVALSVGVLVGRARYERRHRVEPAPPGPRETRRLLRRAERRAHTDWGRWRRITALSRLTEMGHHSSPHLLHNALTDSDLEVVGAGIRLLGALGDPWAIELLVAELREGNAPRSRIAAQLERLAPAAGPYLVPLLSDPEPKVRFWGATLIGPYPELAESDLLALAHDEDPNVRAAAAEGLGHRENERAAAGAIELLDDPAWFVRVHAARAAGRVAGVEAAPRIAKLLADERWWVRTAAKDALRGIGLEAVPALVPVLDSSDGFARNGAAEVLQDIGLVDHLASDEPGSPLLARIYAAGGSGLQEAAESRQAAAPWPGEVRAA